MQPENLSTRSPLLNPSALHLHSPALFVLHGWKKRGQDVCDPDVLLALLFHSISLHFLWR